MSFFGQPQQPQQNQQSTFGFGAPQQKPGGFGAPQQTGFGGGQPQQQQQPQDKQGQLDALDLPIDIQTQEAISCIKFSPSQSQAYMQRGQYFMAVALWDGSTMFWQIQYDQMLMDNNFNKQPQCAAKVQQAGAQNLQCPILGMTWQADQFALIYACADNTIKKWDVDGNQVHTLGQHEAPVKDVTSFIHPMSNQSVVISGGWVGKVKFFTWSAPNMLQQFGESNVAMPVHYMSCVYPLLVTAHQDKIIHVWCLDENFQAQQWEPKEIETSPLKFSTSAISVFGDAKGYAVGSIEGRCGIKNYDRQKADKGKQSEFCFKCHRNEIQGNPQADVYAVNGITFNKAYNTFATYGGDGCIVTWNKDNKAKYRASPKYEHSLTAGAFSDDGKLLAFAIGYDYASGEAGINMNMNSTKLVLRTPAILTEVSKPKQTNKR